MMNTARLWKPGLPWSWRRRNDGFTRCAQGRFRRYGYFGGADYVPFRRHNFCVMGGKGAWVMTEKWQPYEPYVDMETGMAQLRALKMAGKLGEYAREREARLIQTYRRLIAALIAIIFLLAVFA
jgi:hypothetical protein